MKGPNFPSTACPLRLNIAPQIWTQGQHGCSSSDRGVHHVGNRNKQTPLSRAPFRRNTKAVPSWIDLSQMHETGVPEHHLILLSRACNISYRFHFFQCLWLCCLGPRRACAEHGRQDQFLFLCCGTFSRRDGAAGVRTLSHFCKTVLRCRGLEVMSVQRWYKMPNPHHQRLGTQSHQSTIQPKDTRQLSSSKRSFSQSTYSIQYHLRPQYEF